MSTETQLGHDQTFEQYREHAAMNCSTLMYGFTSMLALKEAIDGDYPEPTPGMVFGSQYHCLILEPNEFKRTHVVMPNFAESLENVDGKGKRSHSWATTWAKNRKAGFIDDSAFLGKSIITRDNFDKAVSMIESIQSKPFAMEFMEQCNKEVTLFGKIGGIDFKGRVDLLSKQCLADLKGTSSVSPRLFGSSAVRFRYLEKMSVYRELARQNGCSVDEAWLIAVETSRPFDCCVFPLRELQLDDAYERVLRLIEDYKQCKASGVWPGVDRGEPFVEMYYPNWSMPDDDEPELKGFDE